MTKEQFQKPWVLKPNDLSRVYYENSKNNSADFIG